MGILAKVVKLGVIAKLLQVVQREASKPENRKRASDALNKYKNRRAGKAGHVGMSTGGDE